MTPTPRCSGSGRLWRAARIRIAAGLATAAALAGLAAPAQASPIHPFLEGASLQGFDHACGTAVDSQGDLYVPAAGNPASEAIEVFDPEGDPLAAIEDPNKPCALAVDSKGHLYASDTATGKVLRYSPNAYPFSGTPTYAAPTTIDPSGNAKGISVDPTDDRLYVAEGNRIITYAANGDQGIDEAQLVRTEAACSSTFTLSFEGQTTAPIACSASHAEVQSALEGLSMIGAGNVSVTQYQNAGPEYHLVTFTGALASKDVPELTANPPNCCFIATVTKGFNGHIAEGELSGATGIAPYTYGSAPHYLFAAEPGTDEIKVFSGTDLRELEPRDPIDGSGTPEGELGLGPTSYLATDPISGHLFAYDATHDLLNEFEASGQYLTQVSNPALADSEPTAVAVKPQWDEVQQLVIDAEEGTFKLSFEGDETAPLKYHATDTVVQTALGGLESVGAGNVLVTGGVGNNPYRIAFLGALGKRDLAPLGADGSGLSGDNPVVGGSGPSATVVTLKDGYGPGALHVTSGPGTGSKLLAFGPLPDPIRASLPEPPSHKFEKACGAATDAYGNLYVAGETIIKVYDPAGSEVTSISDPGKPCYLAVDSEGNLYAANLQTAASNDDEAVLYEPSTYPPTGGTTYAENPTPIEAISGLQGIAVDPENDHLFVTHLEEPVLEYKSAKEGSGPLVSGFCGFETGQTFGIDVYGRNHHVYIAGQGAITICNADGSKRLAFIDGSGSPGGAFGGGSLSVRIAVDQSNGHVLVGEMGLRGVVEEFDATGAFVAQFGSFPRVGGNADLAIDNSSGPAAGRLYVAHFKNLSAFGPLKYGEPPVAVTGTASGVGEGNATLNGTVDPRGAQLEECHFEYLTDAQYEANLQAEEAPFTGATSKACAESPAQIGEGTSPVPVHADLTSLDPEGRYRYRLLAKSKFGSSTGDAGLFGPPVILARSAQPILYDEATLRANLDPSGLETTYRFEYGPTESYGQSTPVEILPPGAGPTDVEAFITGLAEGSAYHFRLIAENEAATVEGEDRQLLTLTHRSPQACPNETLRLENNSASLPDCRAYELVTPADMRGNPPLQNEGPGFNNWMTNPSGPEAGNSLAFSVLGTLGEAEGTGIWDAWRMARDPEAGWSGIPVGPSFAEVEESGGLHAKVKAFSPEQLHAFWVYGGGSEGGYHLRTPAGFEALGKGSLGLDPGAEGMFIGPGARHVIFATQVPCGGCPATQLEPQAPTQTGAIYDRSPGGPTYVVSLPPEGASAETQTQFEKSQPTYEGASAEGDSIAFKVAGDLYLRVHDTEPTAETLEVAEAPATFAGIAEDGSRVFFTDNAASEEAAGLYAFDLASEETTQIATNAKFAVVSADGSHVYFVKEGGLYLWDGGAPRLIAALDPEDLDHGGAANFPGTFASAIGLDDWTDSCVNPRTPLSGRANCPTRTSPDGRFLAFQSHADLTGYQAQGHSEIYRYDATDESLLCVSCDPTGAPASADADFERFNGPPAPVQPNTLIPNLTNDGKEVFFQTQAALLPEDANSSLDVYEWQAQGSAECARQGGCLALISAGQGEGDSQIYAMTPSGRDVFFTTLDELTGQDIAASPSIYDARVNGGFPAPTEAEPCHGDACQGEGSAAPGRPAIHSDVTGSGNFASPPKLHCRKGQRRVRRAGKARCVKAHPHKRHKHRRAGR